MASWGEEAALLARGCVPCGLHQLWVAILATRSRPPAGTLGTFGCHYRLSGRLRLLVGTPMIWWKYLCFHLIIMGVALDVDVSQARWQQLKNMSAIIEIGSMISFPKVCNATYSAATKKS